MLLDVLIWAIVVVGVTFGWMAGADKAKREADRAYHKGYMDGAHAVQDKMRKMGR